MIKVATLKGELLHKPVTVTGLLANTSCATQISRRLAVKLGLTDWVDVIVGGLYFRETTISKMSKHVMTATIDGNSYSCYPIVNGNPDDAFYDLIIGEDALKSMSFTFESGDDDGRPDPGPAYEENVDYMGHAIEWISPKYVTPPNGTFLELSCINSTALTRVAVNRSTHQLVAIYHDSNTVYQYNNLPSALEVALLDAFEKNESLGLIVSQVRETCTDTRIDTFPSATIFFVARKYAS